MDGQRDIRSVRDAFRKVVEIERKGRKKNEEGGGRRDYKVSDEVKGGWKGRGEKKKKKNTD